MIEKNAEPPIAGAASSAPSSTADCGSIVDQSMAERSGACENAGGDDDAQFIRTVLSSLKERSPEARKALEQALAHGDLTDPVGCTIPKISVLKVGRERQVRSCLKSVTS
jgi:hypothetical protein